MDPRDLCTCHANRFSPKCGRDVLTVEWGSFGTQSTAKNLIGSGFGADQDVTPRYRDFCRHSAHGSFLSSALGMR